MNHLLKFIKMKMKRNPLLIALVLGMPLTFNACSFGESLNEASLLNEPSKAYPFPNLAWEPHSGAWENAADPVRYSIQIARDAAFAEIVDEDLVFVPRYVHDRPFEPGTYYWRYRAEQDSGSISSWRQTRSFEIKAYDETVTIPLIEGNATRQQAEIRRSVEEAKALSAAGRSVRILFSPGEYHLEDNFTSGLIKLRNNKNIMIDGNGSTIHFASRKQGLAHGIGCENIVVANFQCTFPQGAFRVQGEVVGVDLETGRMTVSVAPGYPGFDASSNILFDIFILLKANTAGRLKKGGANFHRGSDFQKNEDGTWSFTVNQNRKNEWTVGDPYVFNFRAASASFVHFDDSHSITAYNLITEGWGNMGYVSIEGSLFNILHCKTTFAKDRFMTGNADGVHIRGHEVGPWFEGNRIEAIGDDGVALFARPSSINQARPGNNARAVICSDQYFNLEAGDSVSFFNPTMGSILLETEVVSVAKSGVDEYEVTFADDVPQEIITEGKLIERTQIWNRSKSCGNFAIRGSEFLEIRRYGTVFRSKGGVVENNRYVGVSSYAVIFVNGAQWPNGLYASEIVVRNNTIIDSGFEWNGQATVGFRFNGYKTSARSIGPRNILVDGNTFTGVSTPEIELNWAKNVALRSNTVEDRRGSPSSAQVRSTNSQNIID